MSTGYALTSVLVGASALTKLGLNLITPTQSTGWAGMKPHQVAFRVWGACRASVPRCILSGRPP